MIRELKLFHIIDDDRHPELVIDAIHNDEGYQHIREALSKQYNLAHSDLDIQVFSVDMTGDRSLTLHYTQQNRVPLGHATHDVLKHIHSLWKFPVILKAVDMNGQVTTEYHCPPVAEAAPSNQEIT